MKKKIPLFLFSSLLLLASCSNKGNNSNNLNIEEQTSNKTSEQNVSTEQDTNTSTQTSTNQNNTSLPTSTTIETTPIDPEDYQQDITSSFTITTEDGSYNVVDNTYTITTSGTYILSGNLDDGNIVVDAQDGIVELALTGTSIKSSSFSPICVVQAEEVDIKSASETYNEIIDERSFIETEEYDAAIYSESDLDIKGKGYLVVESKYNGIKSKDDLKIKNLALKVTADNNALKGNDSVTVENGNLILISTNGDGIKTSNTDISSKGVQRGNIEIEGGTINIYAYDDAIDAAYNALINENIEELNMSLYVGTYSEYNKTSITSAISSHGISCENEIIYDAGNTLIKSSSDGIHANRGTALDNGSKGQGNININGGYIEVSAKDDGLHADYITTINGGSVNILTSNEGIEGANVIINDGTVKVYALDDGINAGSSTEISSLVKVTGGYVDITVSSGDTDGIDSNGTYQQTGGIVVSKCPTNDNSGNMAALDVDGAKNVTGGTLILVGGIGQFSSNTINYLYFSQAQSGMMPGGRWGQSAASSSQYSFTQGNYQIVLDENNVIDFYLDRTYSNMLIASTNFISGNTYKLISPTDTYTWTQTTGGTQYSA